MALRKIIIAYNLYLGYMCFTYFIKWYDNQLCWWNMSVALIPGSIISPLNIWMLSKLHNFSHLQTDWRAIWINILHLIMAPLFIRSGKDHTHHNWIFIFHSNSKQQRKIYSLLREIKYDSNLAIERWHDMCIALYVDRWQEKWVYKYNFLCWNWCCNWILAEWPFYCYKAQDTTTSNVL